MIFLIDNQLPMGLVGHLQKHGLEATHVSQCGLDRASDAEIWDYAKSHECVIVSKDEDFIHLSGKDPTSPAIVWIRLGNCRNIVLFAAFDTILSDLVQLISDGSKIIEVR